MERETLGRLACCPEAFNVGEGRTPMPPVIDSIISSLTLVMYVQSAALLFYSLMKKPPGILSTLSFFILFALIKFAAIIKYGH